MPIFFPTQSVEEHVPRLLLVDDDPDQLKLLVESMRNTGYRLNLAVDGLQAYDRAVSTQPDLIVLDVRMPKLDGFALCRRLKANPATSHIPVIFLSSAGDVHERLTGLDGGAVDYILKPYAAQEVLARVRIHLSLAGKIPPAGVARIEPPMDDDEVLVRAAQLELRACLSITPRMTDIARKLGVHERRLARAFRKCLGTTVFDYLREARMKEAERLLRETSLTMVAISYELGFSNSANFSTAFRDHTGMAPSAYRLQFCG